MKGVPVRLSNAPLAFQCFMNNCLVGPIDLVYIRYLDGVFCCSKTFDEHLGNLMMVLQGLKQHGLKLRAEKCLFFKNEVTYLRKVVSEEGYRDNPVEVKAIKKFKQKPSNIGDLRTLLRFIAYNHS